MSQRSYAVPLLVTSGLVVLTWVFLSNLQLGLRGGERDTNHLPQLVLTDFFATQMNEQGFRHYTISGPLLTQMPGEQGSWLEQPLFNSYLGDGRTQEWQIQGQRAWIAADHSLVRLEDAVHMQRLPSSGLSPVEIDTRDVRIYPETKVIETEAAAQLQMPGTQLQSTGVRAEMARDWLELQSVVRAQHKPPTTP